MIHKFTVTFAAAVFCIFSVSCSLLSEDRLLKYALELAGDNRPELEKVLDRYSACPEDSLKYEAAKFLIMNMPYYSYYEGELLDNYMEYFYILRDILRRDGTPDAAVDTIRNKYGPFSTSKLVRKRDIEVVDSAYLCHNIDWAFKVWREQPWGKNVSFEDFKEQILPYRIGDEKLLYWRESYYNKFNERFRREYMSAGNDFNIEDPVEAAIFISKDIFELYTLHFTTTAPAALPHVGPEVAWNKCGSCKELSDFVVYACRALGIPCSLDYMPILKNENVDHTWVTYRSLNGELYFQEFLRGVLKVKGSHLNVDPKMKVFRHTYGMNWDEYNKIRKFGKDIIHKFRSPHYQDVTDLYAIDYIDRIHIPEERLNDVKVPRLAYLCGNSQFSWIPLAWAEYKRNGLVFNNLDKGDIMRVVGFDESGNMIYLTDPFHIDEKHELRFIKPSDELQDMTVYSRTPLSMEYEFSSKMVGGVFEGSNDPEFREKDTLHVIEELPIRLYETATVTDPKKYRYVRYFGPKNAFCKLSELQFRESREGRVLYGKNIGTPNYYSGVLTEDYDKVFDGMTWTSFTYYGAPYGGWVGKDFGRPEQVGFITYTHSNMDNYVRPGDTYELHYCDGTWKSAGKLTAQSDSLVFHDVPANALYLLKNLSRGYAAAVFTYENGVQVWEH